METARCEPDSGAMAADPLRQESLPAAHRARVSYLGSAPAPREPGEPHVEELEELRSRLQTERSAGTAMLSAMLELERKLDAERAELRRQRLDNQRQWDQIHTLECLLHQAERPAWRRLLNR